MKHNRERGFRGSVFSSCVCAECIIISRRKKIWGSLCDYTISLLIALDPLSPAILIILYGEIIYYVAINFLAAGSKCRPR